MSTRRPLARPLVLALAVPLACGDSSAIGSGTATGTTTGDAAPSGTEPPTSTGAPLTTASTEESAPDSSSTASTGSTTALASLCGDAIVDPGEECDKGDALNSDAAYCTEQCKLNICGDGLLLVGHEICDEGDANSDDYGATCGADCKPGARCGDNLVQPGEECDHGPDNGAPRGDRQVIGCDMDCRMKARLLFVSSQAFTGALGGLDDADETCQILASLAGLPDPERFRAFLSDDSTSMQERYAEHLGEQLPYIAVTGHKFADSYDALLAFGPGDAGVHVTETGATLLGVYVATNIAADGSIYEDPNLIPTDCDGWTSEDKAYFARVGFNAVALDSPQHASWKSTKAWASHKNMSCNTPMHLYCLEL